MPIQNQENEPWVELLKMNGYVKLASRIEEMADSVFESVSYHDGNPGSLWRSWGVTSRYDIKRFQELGEADARAVYDAIREDKGELERKCEIPRRGTFLSSDTKYEKIRRTDSQNPDT